MKQLRVTSYSLWYVIFLISCCSAKDWNFYKKNLQQPTRTLQLPLHVQFFGTIRNDTAWNSRSYLPGFVTDLSAWVPTDEIGLDDILVFEPGNLAQRPLASIVNIAPLIGVKISGPPSTIFEYYAYVDSEFVPFGTYLTTAWFFPSITALLNTKFLVNWAFVEGIIHPQKVDDHCHSLLIGQFTHPLATTITFPRIVGYSQGAPIVPFALNPQIKYSFGRKGWTTKLTLYTEAEYQDAGFEPSYLSSTYIRLGLIPGTNLTIEYADDTLIFGAGINIQRIVPRSAYTYPLAFDATSTTNQRYAAKESLVSVNGNLYGMYEISTVRTKWQWLLGQNGESWGNAFGYGVTRRDDIGGFAYKNMLFTTMWVDLEARCPNSVNLQPGLFLGYMTLLRAPAKLGRDCNGCVILPEFSPLNYFYNLSTGYHSVVKVSPRCWWYYHPNFHIGFEIDYTSIVSANTDPCGNSLNSSPSQLLRFVVSTQYNF